MGGYAVVILLTCLKALSDKLLNTRKYRLRCNDMLCSDMLTVETVIDA